MSPLIRIREFSSFLDIIVNHSRCENRQRLVYFEIYSEKLVAQLSVTTSIAGHDSTRISIYLHGCSALGLKYSERKAALLATRIICTPLRLIRK